MPGIWHEKFCIISVEKYAWDVGGPPANSAVKLLPAKWWLFQNIFHEFRRSFIYQLVRILSSSVCYYINSSDVDEIHDGMNLELYYQWIM